MKPMNFALGLTLFTSVLAAVACGKREQANSEPAPVVAPVGSVSPEAAANSSDLTQAAAGDDQTLTAQSATNPTGNQSLNPAIGISQAAQPGVTQIPTAATTPVPVQPVATPAPAIPTPTPVAAPAQSAGNARSFVMIKFPNEIVAKNNSTIVISELEDEFELSDLPYTTEDIYNSQGDIVIPKGSRIRGTAEVRKDQPSIFRAQQIIAGQGGFVPVTGTAYIPSMEVRTGYDATGNFLAFTVGGGLLGALVGELTGDVDWQEVAIGAGAGLVGATIIHYTNDRYAVAVGGASVNSRSALCLGSSSGDCF